MRSHWADFLEAMKVVYGIRAKKSKSHWIEVDDIEIGTTRHLYLNPASLARIIAWAQSAT